ncbi:hypothetical protein [Alloprevotella tannerae]
MEKQYIDKYGNLVKGKIELDGMLILNPTPEQLKAAGFVEVEEVETFEERLRNAKEAKMREIEAYAQSDNVNILYFNNTPTWLDKETRANYKLSLDAAELLKEKEITFVVEGNVVKLPIEKARMILAKVQRYADDTFIVSSRHKLEVSKMDKVEDVESFDITADYPEPLKL